MTIRLRTVFFLIIGFIIVWFLYIERTILTPFVLGAIFAYLFNPLVSFMSAKARIPRLMSVALLYLIIFLFVGFIGTFISRQVIKESSELKQLSQYLLLNAKAQLKTSPQWFSSIVNDVLITIQRSNLFTAKSIFYLFPQVLYGLFGFIVFMFSSFYFLKDGKAILDKILNFIPGNYRIEFEILLKKINIALDGYLRGEIFLIFFVSVVLFIALSITGVKFALLLAIFSGLAEIVPIIGPIVAGLSAILVVFTTGSANFSLTPVAAALVVGGIYFIMRQFQDYIVTPYIMGRITRLHPLLIFFVVLAGEHLWGILGLILAVPITAVIRIILEFSLDKINEQNPGRNKPDSVYPD